MNDSARLIMARTRLRLLGDPRPDDSVSRIELRAELEALIDELSLEADEIRVQRLPYKDD